MKVLVTGAGGFLGGAIARKLVERGDSVRSFSRGEHPALAALGAEQARGDLADLDAVRGAARGCEAVFHVAALPGVWGRYEDFHRANALGTENVIRACREAGIARLVHTSTPSVVFDGRDMEGADESAPYAAHPEAHYPATKILAERAVLAANGPDLATVALRPHLIWGPGDNHLVPRILARARAGRLRIVGDGRNRVDIVYVDNAADAHLLALDRLTAEGPRAVCAGRAYFVTDGEPRPLWDVVNRILAAGGLPPLTRKVPGGVAVAAGAACELVWRAFGLGGEPPMTRFVARELATSHWFDISAARRDLGYSPAFGYEEGMQRLEAWLRDARTT